MAAAIARRIPTLLLEQNAQPGFTNRVLARYVGGAAVTFASTVGYFGRRGFVAGNPVRPEFFTDSGTDAVAGPPRVLIFGGSQGAHAINVAMVEAAPRLATLHGGVAITHQTGERDLELVRSGYQRAGLAARVEPYLFAMDREIRSANLVVCRAGATTMAELAAAGRPSVLVPLPTAADDHQRKNAEVFRDGKAAELIEQKHLTGAVLADRIASLLADRPGLEAMGAAARGFAKPNAASDIVDRALELAAPRRTAGDR